MEAFSEGVPEQGPSPTAPRWEAYRKGLNAFPAGVRHGRRNCELVEVPYEDTTLPAYFVAAEGVDGPAPVMVAYNGLDSMKEMNHGSGIAHELARRGISTFIVDHQGSAEALRLRGLTGYHDSERWSAPVVDYLENRGDVDPDRIGVMGWSLGGYYAPRCRIREAVQAGRRMGANYNSGELQQRRLANEGDRPVPHYWDHVHGSSARTPSKTSCSSPPSMSLVGAVEQITIPFLITRGEDDTQIPLEYVHA